MATTAETLTFTYKGKNRKGEKVDGELRSNNLAGAKSQLRKQGVISTSIRKKSKPIVDTKDRTFGNHYSDKSLT